MQHLFRHVWRSPKPRFVTFATLGFMMVGAPLMSGLPKAAAQSGEDAAASLESEIQAHLTKAQTYLDEVLAVQGNHTVENTLEPLNKVSIELNDASSKAGLLENVHPDELVRKAGEEASQAVSSFITDLSLNRAVYDALSTTNVDHADAETKRLVETSLRNYRRSGVDKDEATRNHIRELNEELVLISQEFSRNIREGRLTVEFEDPSMLAGLPQDYIDAHALNEEGKIVISTDYPDYIPALKYAKSTELRKNLYHEFNNRAYPGNLEVFKKLLAKRYELARALGYENYAAYITEDKMAKTQETVADFIDQMDQAAKGRAEQDYKMLLDRKKKDDPTATAVEDYEKSYYSELVRAEQYDFDSQELRQYFNYPQVKDGILNLCANLFGVEFRQVLDAATWYSDVECWDVVENGEKRGRFYLDMHPRDGKYSHAAQFSLQTGVTGVQEPQAVLVCNFPKPDSNGVGLMSHEQVETFLHEFGHLLHTLFGGDHRWADQSGIATEWDFVEAPSQMLEEWAIDASTLQTFAKHYQTGEPIPTSLVAKLKRSRDFGNGIYITQQNFYTAVSLNAYNQPPDQVEMGPLVQALQKTYSSFGYVDGNHMYCSFGHLDGYSAMYYTYMWSLVIAKDLFSHFDENDMLNPETATRYRKLVLEPGGTEDAADLIKDFLGRPYNFEAFANWLNGAS